MSIEKAITEGFQLLSEAIIQAAIIKASGVETETKTLDKPAKQSTAKTQNATEAEQKEELSKLSDEHEADLVDLDYDTDVKPAFQTYATNAGRDAALALLKKFGVEGKLTKETLPASKYAKFIAACNG